MCHLDYCCSSWYPGLTLSLKKKLQVCQNKVARFILNLDNRGHIGPEELHSISWLDTYHRSKQLKLSHVHDVYNNNGPTYLSENFTKINETHKYNTRSSECNFFLPRVQGTGKSTFYFTGSKDWNDLPKSIKNIRCKSSFKQKVKTHLDSEMFRIEADIFYYYWTFSNNEII